MTQIGPFFYIRGKLIYNACSLVEGREQAGKLDNPYGHDQLYDDHFKSGEYIDYPRGRVLWDEEKITQSFTLPLVYIVTMFYLRS